jgi:hypothetical protein
MENWFQLQINFESSLEIFNAISVISGLTPLPHCGKPEIPNNWTYEVIQKESEPYFDFINIFMDVVESKFEQLSGLGIKRENISVWLIYNYDGQCNMEFDPKRLKRLSDNAITLCISCYDIHDYDKDGHERIT